MSDGMLLVLLLSLPFAGSLLAGFLPTNARNAAVGLAGSIAVATTAITVLLHAATVKGGYARTDISWIPSLGLNFTLRIDGIAWLFCLLICGIGALIVLYARYYMSAEDPVPRFFSFLLAFMGAMLGIVLSGNIIQLVFFWELTSLFSFLLIGYWYHNAAARDGARMALTVTGAGGLCLLVGMLLLGRIVGSYDLDRVLEAGGAIRQSPLYLPALILILIGAFTKSAQFPFHFWLPQAMAAPTPVSAYLHSTTMVKAGVFLMARLWPVMAGTDAWFYLMVPAGLTTLVLGAYFAIFQQDMKGLLAYSTISNLGLTTLLLGLGSPLAAVAATFHILNHAIFKASLFMATGIIDHETGTRDLTRLSGLFRSMPITGSLAMISAAAMAGVPLLNGFVSKEMFFAEAVETHTGSLLDESLPYFATLAGIFSVAYSIRFIAGAFFGPPATDLPRTPHEPPSWMRRPVEILAVTCLIIGILPGRTVGPLLADAARAVVGHELPYYSLAVWHGFNTPLVMSLIALGGGVLLYFGLRRYLDSGVSGPPLMQDLDSRRFFESVMLTISWKWARSAQDVLETRRLQPQMRFLLIAAFLAGMLPLAARGFNGVGPVPASPADPIFLTIWVIGLACALGAAYQAKFHRLAALLLMGGAGLVTCITFLWFSAPDLALTQLLVEIVTTVLILLGLRWLPKRIEADDTAPTPAAVYRRYRDFAVSVAMGVGVSFLAYAVLTRPLPDTVSRFFVERAYTEGGGTNIVNVILVDFRGFDTLGEITVLCIVALTVFAMLRRFRPAPESVDAPEQQRIQNAYDEAAPDRSVGDTVAGYLFVPRLVTQWLFPVIAVLAVYIFMRGHDLPGGGFAAGVALSIGFVLQYMGSGVRRTEQAIRVLPLAWMGLGLITAAGAGTAAIFFDVPFLTTYAGYTHLPVIGDVPTASALIFDLGVFALVVGATVLMLIALGHQSLRAGRKSEDA